MGKTATEEDFEYKRRTLFQVLWTDGVNIAYFFAPLVVAHNLAWVLKPFVMDPRDLRGPWEALYAEILKYLGEDPKFLLVQVTFFLNLIVYILGTAFFMLLDYAKWPHFLYKYKMNPGANAPPDRKKVIKLLKVVTINLTISWIGGFFSWPIYEKFGDLKSANKVPTVYAFFFYMYLGMLGHDFSFYHAHRLMHHKFLYKRFHKWHHEWVSPIAPAAIYTHPLEHTLIGIAGPSLGLLLSRPPIPVFWVWLTWLNIQVQNDHSGFHFPLVYSPEFHDFHHLRFHTCYGWLNFWDWVYGTDKEFQVSKLHKERHFRLHTLKSAREIVPDPIKEKEQ